MLTSFSDLFNGSSAFEQFPESDDDYGTDCESVLAAFNSKRLSKLNGKTSTEKSYLGKGLTETSERNTLIPDFGHHHIDQPTAVTSPRTSFVERPSFLSESGISSRAQAPLRESAISSSTDEDRSPSTLKGLVFNDQPSVNTISEQDAALQKRKGGARGSQGVQPPLLRKRRAPEFSKDQFSSARQTISVFVNNFLPISSPTKELDQTLEKLEHPYKRQHFHTQESTPSPAISGLALARPASLLAGLSSLAPSTCEAGAGRQQTPMFGGSLTLQPKLRKNTQDISSDQDLFDLQHLSNSASRLPSLFGHEAKPVHHDEVQAGSEVQEDSNATEAEAAPAAAKCAKEILFSE